MIDLENNKTGWEQDKRTHFDDIVMGYDKIRPGYPGKLFEDIMDFIGPGKKKALEIGAGTGKATLPFLEVGYAVTAVELGSNMAAFLKERFKSYTDFNVTVAAFEDAALEDCHYDLIYAATAFHWVTAEIGCPKVYRLLRKGGVFALFRYNAIPSFGEALYEEIQEVYEEHYYSYYKTSKKPFKDEYGQQNQLRHRFGFNDMRDYGFDDITMKLYDGTQTYSADEYIALLETMSDHRHLPDYNRAALYAGVRTAIFNHGGFCRSDITFQLYMGRKY